ncbi:uncharacterized protein LOC128955761 [Oppia nitens]|uniref:uncharacterized protein LOC128955761 n=1 Tax=Oppia nitens TaxID=1686743 RepID=UPI0023DAE6A0|nr:uncharacterized protein LOC128955761 [Oppia nitens]
MSFNLDDDLCELILSYMSFEDRLHMECVSRQWSRVIYTSIHRSHNNIWNCIENSTPQIKLAKLKLLFRKCNQLTNFNYSNLLCDRRVMSMIATNCDNICRLTVRFESSINPIQVAIQEMFAKKCGPNLLSINICEYDYDDYNSGYYLEHLIVYKNYYQHLCDICVPIDSYYSYLLFLKFTDKYSNQLSQLKLIFNFNAFHIPMNEMIEDLPVFSKLQKLTLILKGGKLDLSSGSVQLATKFPKLTHLDIDCRFDAQKPDGPLLSKLSAFKTLKSLKLKIRIKDVELGSLQSLQANRLRELYIVCQTLSDKHFEDIDKYFPYLEKLEIKTLQFLSNTTLESLAKLRQLRSLRIFCKPYCNTFINDIGIHTLLNGCPSLKTVVFKCGLNITEMTIIAVMCWAERSPDRHHVFEYCWGHYKPGLDVEINFNADGEELESFQQDINQINAMIYLRNLEVIPNNLHIYCREYDSYIKVNINEYDMIAYKGHLNLDKELMYGLNETVFDSSLGYSYRISDSYLVTSYNPNNTNTLSFRDMYFMKSKKVTMIRYLLDCLN